MMMARSITPLPQLQGVPLLSDGGLETTLVFHHGIDLPEFAAFDLLRRDRGREVLREYFLAYLRLAREKGVGFLLETPTWRANPAFANALGYDLEELAEANRQAVALLQELRQDHGGEHPVVISGCIGPRGDGYSADAALTAEAAENFHQWQIAVLADAGVDLVTAFTISTIAEAIGITAAAARSEVPVVISFTLETDGRLPSGESLAAAIQAVDAATDPPPAYYMINCAHPTHFARLFEAGESWVHRIGGLRANASRRSHAELDAAEDLDAGDPQELAEDYRRLLAQLPRITVVGGCCGTDLRHVEAIARSTLPVLWEQQTGSLRSRMSMDP